jgi:hypothetical protein
MPGRRSLRRFNEPLETKAAARRITRCQWPSASEDDIRIRSVDLGSPSTVKWCRIAPDKPLLAAAYQYKTRVPGDNTASVFHAYKHVLNNESCRRRASGSQHPTDCGQEAKSSNGEP